MAYSMAWVYIPGTTRRAIQAKAVHGTVGCQQNYERMSRNWCKIS